MVQASVIPSAALTQHVIALGPCKASVKPTKLDAAYAAGFFDGEGNVVIALNHQGGARGIYPVYNMRIGAAQKEPSTLFWLRDRWGGSVRKARTGHHTWQAFSLGALAFLRDVLPYLQVKNERARLAIEYQHTVARRGRAGRTPAYVASLAALKAEMNCLNAGRGRAAVQR